MLRCRPDLVPTEYVNSPTSIGIKISDSSWNSLSEVSTLASVRPSACLLRSVPESWVLHKGLAGGGGCPTERESERKFFPFSVLSEGDFILTGEVARTFGLTPAVTPGMAESYDEPVGAIVWGEDMLKLPVLFGLLVAIMWMFKSFAGKEPASLEGRTIDVGNVKVHVRNAIAEGGFSCIYVATDVVQPSKQYALKHVICNDDDLLDLITKEISVMKLLRGHPNVVALVAHTILDMGRRKEALLVMEFCEKSLATLLENRGSGYFEEKQVLLIFRDVCNAVYFMHSQSPPVAHRDLKAENVLLGPDGAWKLCDFGSTSTNHKCFDKSEEMGIEEDNIRKYTTPAYRAPEV
ncbi:hypothetical protein B296_00023357 [Ensete ventricosum]|uniref:non-specific serine/threonine protein kinase n=1 Tax=Ensete ventricosum TaxID=4639 RepID=A0A426YVN3_ENSVE|nr:hypothetical protein B296_00023357 [Ensete ventricosum]